MVVTENKGNKLHFFKTHQNQDQNQDKYRTPNTKIHSGLIVIFKKDNISVGKNLK